MSGKWQGSTRRAQLPPDWRTRRARVLARDGHRCTETTEHGRCPAPATDVDHIERGDNHDDSNLTSKCSPHHARKSAREGGLAGERRTRPPEPHPGLL